MRPVQRRWVAAGLLLVGGGPMLWVTVLALAELLNASAWRALAEDPLWHRALALTLWTGLLSTTLAWWLSAALLAQGFVQNALSRLLRGLPLMLATPHAAFAIGLVFLIAPSGWLLRLVSPSLSGFEHPPPWPTSQDPWGLGLVLALVAKEIPFLLWTAASQLQRDDVRQRWRAEHALAQTLGYPPQRAYWRVVWPQLAPRLAWPLMAVLAYGLTNVDMALVIGPSAPPTLAVLAWQWLRDADPALVAQGSAAGGLLGAMVLFCASAWLGLRHWRLRHRAAPNGRRGHRPARQPIALATMPCAPAAPVCAGLSPAEAQRTPAQAPAWAKTPRQAQAARLPGGLWLLAGLYAAVLFALAVGSVAGLWPFPAVWPTHLSGRAWLSVAASSSTLWTTLSLALAASALALAWCVAWLEYAPTRWDQRLRPLFYLPLVLPAVLWVLGLYRLALFWEIEGQWIGLLLAHTLMVLPYVLLTLSPAYQGFDPRCAQLSASLGHGRWRFLLRVKWPLLRRALAASAAVGVAVSVAQYLPTLYIGGGRFASVTTEAVALASGAQRSLTSAYAWLQFVLPVLGFALAAWIGRPRRFAASSGSPHPCLPPRP